VVQGFPGTGKSDTLARIVCALVLLGKKVLIQSHSNSGCCAVFKRIIELAKVHLPDDVDRNAFVRLPSATIDRRIAADIADRQAIDTMPSADEERAKIDPDNVPYLLSTLKDKWVDDHRDSMDDEDLRLAELFEAWKKARKTAEASDEYAKIQTLSMVNDYKDGENHVNNRVMERTCRNTMVFAATSSMVHQLREEDFFKPDVLVFDECSQAIEPALLAAHMKDIKQLIIGGDLRQLGPVVHSTQTSPLGKQLSVSPMDRLPLAYPHMPLVQPVNNYRGHAETIDTCSYMIYEDLMKPGIVPWLCRDDSTGAKVAAFMAAGGTNDIFQRSILLVQFLAIFSDPPVGISCNARSRNRQLRSYPQGFSCDE
jgi:hypothetical protein